MSEFNSILGQNAMFRCKQTNQSGEWSTRVRASENTDVQSMLTCCSGYWHSSRISGYCRTLGRRHCIKQTLQVQEMLCDLVRPPYYVPASASGDFNNHPEWPGDLDL